MQPHLRTLTLPATEDSILVAFRDLGWNSGGKAVLKHVSGVIRQGELCLLLGPSGAGKTTLLHLIGIPKEMEAKGSMSGWIWHQHALATISKQVRWSTAYVTQDIQFPEVLSSRQLLRFYADIHHGISISDLEKDAMVDRIATTMRLTEQMNTLVMHLSGGELRRLSVGCELTSQAQLLILDEPTSGLSATDAMLLVTALKELTQQGCTVLASIHQPRSQIFFAADRVLFMMKGTVVYSGKPQQIVADFTRFGVDFPIHQNPADVLMDFMQDPSPAQGQPVKVLEVLTEFRATGDRSKGTFKGKNAPSDRHHRMKSKYIAKEVGMTRTDKDDLEILYEKHRRSSYPANEPIHPLQASYYIAQRTMRVAVFHPASLLVRVVLSLLMATIISSVFWRSKAPASTVSALFFTFAYLLVSAIVAIPLMLSEQKIFYADFTRKKYSIGAFLLGNMIGSVPVEAFLAAIFATVCYWSIALRSGAEYYFFFVAVCVLVAVCGSFFNQVCIAVTRNFVGAVALSGFFMAGFLLFMGYFVRLSSIPRAWRWVYYANYYNYAFSALVSNQLSGQGPQCRLIDVVSLKCLRQASLFSGDDYLLLLEINRSKWLDFGIILVFPVFFKVLHLGLLHLFTVYDLSLRALSIVIEDFKYRRSRVYITLLLIVLAAASLVVGVALTTAPRCHFPNHNYIPLDGRCHNRHFPEAGRVNGPLLERYTGGAGEPRDRVSIAEDQARLPNARELSNRLFAVLDSVDGYPTDVNNVTALQMAIGQFFVHDVSFFASDYSKPIIVPIPRCDAVFDSNCTGQASFRMYEAERKNSVTAWVDLSPVYGTDKKTANSLRSFISGKMKTTPEGYLPWYDGSVQMDGTRGVTNRLKMAGDRRANGNILLHVMHTLMLRAHNLYADEVAASDPKLSDDEIFWKARQQNIRLFNAMAFVLYLRSYFPGDNVYSREEFHPDDLEFAGEYNVDRDFVLLYRFHSMVPPKIKVVNSSWDVYDEIEIGSTVYNPELLEKYGLEDVLRGMSVTPAKAFGSGYIDALRNIKYKTPLDNPEQYPAGMDLAVVDIVRARQLRVPRYNYLRAMHSLPPATSFKDFGRCADVLEELYKDPNNVEGFIGVQCERAFPGHSLHELAYMNAVRIVTRDRSFDELYHIIDTDLFRSNVKVPVLGEILSQVSHASCLAPFPNRMPANNTNPIKCS